MRESLGIVMVIMALNSPGIAARGIDALEQRLREPGRFAAAVEYSVTMPQVDEPVVYSIRLASETVADDRYSPADYLISWQLPTPSGLSEGFSAYFDGHFYAWRGERIREYHADWDSIPLMAGGGVQRNAQFVDLLPPMIADQLQAFQSDSTFTYEYLPEAAFRGRRAMVVKAVQTIGGYDVKQVTMAFDPATSLPMAILTDYNVGSISEQNVSATFHYDDPTPVPRSEEELAALFPDQFERYRESNYSVETLPGNYLPAFSLPTLTGERYSRSRADGFRAPTVVVLFDPAQQASAQMVDAIRKARDTAPKQFDVVWVSVGSNPDQAEALVGEARMGESLLLSGRSLARDCGASAFPVAIVADSLGRVAKVMLGFNNDVATDVIQSIVLVN